MKFSTFSAIALAAALAAAPGMAMANTGTNGGYGGASYNNGNYNNGNNGGYSNGRWNNGGNFINNNGYGGGGHIGTGLSGGNANGNGGNGGTAGNQNYYGNIGYGGYAGTAVIPNGNNNNNNNNNSAHMRISQRNNLLTDNGDARVSRVIGSGVWNAQNRQVGTVNDVLVGRNGVFAVVGAGDHQVVVPFREFVFGNAQANGNDRLILPRVTQAQLNHMPPYYYYLDHNPRWNNTHDNG